MLNKSTYNEFQEWQSKEAIQKAYLSGIISDSQIEKAWTKHPIGTEITRKDGQRYKKISETGNSNQDWKLVTKDKNKSGEPESERDKQAKVEEGNNTNLKPEDLKEHAKNTSEQALTNAIKQSDDPTIREQAHQELDRREKEEKVQEDKEGENSGGEKKDEKKKEENQYVEKFRMLSDEQIKFYLDAPYPEVKSAAKMIAEERGLKVVNQEDYIKGFEDFSEEDGNRLAGRLYEQYKNDSKLIRGKLSLKSNEDQQIALNTYIGNGYTGIRLYLNDPDNFDKNVNDLGNKTGKAPTKMSGDEIKQISNDLSNFIQDNKIKKDLSLHRRVYTNNSFFTKLKEGDIYEDKSFSSSSLKKLSQFGDFNINILAKKGSNVANVDNPGEFEYLIDKGSKFRVLSKDSKGIIVELL